MSRRGFERPEARLAAAAGLLALFPLADLLVGSGTAAWLPGCTFRTITGLPCPLCGLTHAFACAGAGRFAEATAHNPLWPLAAAAVLVFASLLLCDAVRPGEKTERLARTLLLRRRGLVAALAAYGAVRALLQAV